MQYCGSEDLVFVGNNQIADNNTNNDDFQEDKSIYEPNYTGGERDGSFSDSYSDSSDVRRVYNEGNNFVGRHTDSGEEDSVYNFASKRSAPPSEDKDEDKDSDQPSSNLQHTVNKLFAFFQGDIGSYIDDQHYEHYQQYIANVANNDYYRLNNIFNNPNRVLVLTSFEMLTLEQLRRYMLPTPEQLQSIYYGISLQYPQPRYMYLHQEETREQALRQVFNINSYLGFLHSLAACREGLQY